MMTQLAEVAPEKAIPLSLVNMISIGEVIDTVLDRSLFL